MLRVWLPQVEDDEFLRPLRAAVDGAAVLFTEEGGGAAHGADILVRGVPTRAQMEAAPGLRHLVIPYAGVPEATRSLLRAYPQVQVHNLHHNARPVAELALALLLALAKEMLPLDRALRNGDWTPRYSPSRTVVLAGRRALLLGYGAIGKALVPMLRGLGMEVAAIRRRGGEEVDPMGVTLHPPSALDTLLPRALALMICLPLTDATRGLMGARELALLPSDAFLVNVGRGPLVDETALFEALRGGRLGGAGLDVWYRYPRTPQDRAQTRPADHPFETLDNVVMSPHRAGHSRQTERRRAEALGALLHALAAGDEAANRVDLEHGY